MDATLYQQGSPLRLLLADTGELAIRPGASITVLLLPGGGKPVRSQVKVLEVEPTHDQQIIKVELPDQDLPTISLCKVKVGEESLLAALLRVRQGKAI